MQYAPPVDRPPPLYRMVHPDAPSAVDGFRWNDLLPADRFDVTKRFISGDLAVGRTVYPLRSPVVGSFYPGRHGGEGEFVVPEFGPALAGRGGTLNDAFLDWRDQVHRRFQELYAKRPFEMDDDETEAWRLLESQIDVAVYRNRTPLIVKQVGKVAPWMRPHPERVEWEDGFVEAVDLDQMPGEFAAYRPGQPFEAWVKRDPVDHRLLEVVHVRRIGQLPWLTRETFDDFIRSIPTTESLPETDWE
jgi:hypothetical protein